MVKYEFSGDTFIIKDYLNGKTFSSFLPAIAGERGKPMWVFYASVGQCVGGFGVDSRNTPITPFDSATLAYQNIPLKGFRTFIKVNGKTYEPFSKPDDQILKIDKTNITIEEKSNLYEISVNYNTISNEPFNSLIRKVTITNPSSKTLTYDILDGLPVFFPYGLDNVAYKEEVSLMQAYCQIHNLDKKAPFVKFKTSTGDNPVVKERVEGNGFYSFYIRDGKKIALDPFINLDLVFGGDSALIHPVNFIEKEYKEFINQTIQEENILPCAFSGLSISLEPGESLTFYSLYGSFSSLEEFNTYIVNNDNLLDIILKDETSKIVNDLLKSVDLHTSNEVFDNYIKQSYLDNGLRGGFPTLIGNTPYYVYGRKHGDMERDYNFFNIPYQFYSSGNGNFRDINQNRRNDLYFAPYLNDYNIKTFFNLIQIDGQNPLTIKPNSFHIKDTFDLSILDKYENRQELKELIKDYSPSSLYTYLKDKDQLELFEMIIDHSNQEVEASFSEGYWIDHWTYNVDLLENYIAIYPDRIKDLLFDDSYKYFYSLVYVNPRSEKYCLTEDKQVRQYGAIDLKAVEREAKDKGFDMNETHWLVDKHGTQVQTTLLSKIFNLILIKFSTLDSKQLGIEMECEKPGWNDAMNGLPGLFSSGLSETVELLRLTRFLSKSLRSLSKKDRKKSIYILLEQYSFYKEVNKNLDLLIKSSLSSFSYWDKVTSARETFRDKVHYFVKGASKKIKINDIILFLSKVDSILTKGIKEAKEIGGGILPSYLIYNVKEYEETGKVSHLGLKTVKVKEFTLETIPPFLEASARMFKLGKDVATLEDYKYIKESDLYDKSLGIYKTCAAIDDAPFEIGRVHAFTKGWLERECDFVHMAYKYLLGLLEAGYYDEFYTELKTNFVCYMDPSVYGRSPIENVSFIVPTCNPDSSRWGRGYFARLTGANSEVLNMSNIIFIGEHPFKLDTKGTLTFSLNPVLPSSFFDGDDKVSYTFLGKIKIIYHNPSRIDTYKGSHLLYKINDKEYKDIISEPSLVKDIRAAKIDKIEVEVIPNESL
ncbi:MAG: hypothetical protein LUD22_01470 [Coprobacillus sp.]|nr:hypothetical protein [Coprobacillus sp.]